MARRGWLRRIATIVVALLVLGGAGYATLWAISWARLSHVFATTMAAPLCAGVFISGRTPADIDQQSFSKKPPRDRIYGGLTPVIDYVDRRVVVTGPWIAPVEAHYVEGRGCVMSAAGTPIAPIAARGVAAAPGDIRYAGHTAVTTAPLPPAVDAARLDKAIAANFADPAHLTHAMLVYKDGQLLRESYGGGGGPDFRAESWSLGKTIVGVLAGRLIATGRLTLDEPVALAGWAAGDPRRGITVRNLLNMAGGLAFTTEGTFWPVFAQSDHGLIYTDLPDTVAFAADRPLARAPGSLGDYNNADPTVLLAYIRQKLGLDADGLLRLVRDEVLAPLGMDGVVLSTDPAGNPVITGYVYGRARDWAKIGLMLADEGRHNGAAFLDPAFVRFMAEPAPNYPDAAYGGMIWLNRHRYYNAPADAMVMAGAGDQVVIVLPRERIVIVRMGHLAKSPTMFAAFNGALGEMIGALAPQAPGN